VRLCSKCSATTILQGRYRLRKRLGTGGTSQVFLADDTETNETRAIKILQVQGTKDWKGIEHFERQLLILRSLDHPGIPKVYAHFENDFLGRYSLFSVQQWIEGDNLEERVKGGLRFQEKDALQLLERLLEIVAYLHSFSPPILHRDIKPRNIILTADGKPVLIDFDTARGIAIDKERADGTMVGTAGFVPMEQLAGQAAPASDIYALGMTMIAVLSHKDVLEIPVERMRIKFEPYVNVSKHIVSVLRKMVEPIIEDRYQSIAEIKADLARAEQTPEKHKPSYLTKKTSEEKPETPKQRSNPQQRARNSSPQLAAVIKPVRREENGFLALQQDIEKIQHEAKVNPQVIPSPPSLSIEEERERPHRQPNFFDLQEKIQPGSTGRRNRREERKVASSGSGTWLWIGVAAGIIGLLLVAGSFGREKESGQSIAAPVSVPAVDVPLNAPTAVGEPSASLEVRTSPVIPQDIVWASKGRASDEIVVFGADRLSGPPTDFGLANNFGYWQSERLRGGAVWIDVEFSEAQYMNTIWIAALSGLDLLVRVDDLSVSPPEVLWRGGITETAENIVGVFSLSPSRRISQLRFVFNTNKRIERLRIDAVGLSNQP
jgi:serine/threonine protein kinase